MPINIIPPTLTVIRDSFYRVNYMKSSQKQLLQTKHKAS